ncbi:MAG: membrane dipeptidase [Bacteroidetes bacterium]|nr:membrane dipeptidase [Bacteroidota bacterium]
MPRFTFFFLSIFLIGFHLHGQVTDRLHAKAERIHRSVFTVDSHADTPMNFFDPKFNVGVDNSSSVRRSKVDFPRMSKGGLDGIFFAVFTGQGSRTAEGNEKARKSALQTFDSIYSNVTRNSGIAGIVTTPDEAYRIVKKGKRAIFIGVENGYPVGTDLSNVKLLFDRGARYMTLCHTKNNDICSSSTDSNNTVGLTEFGRQVVPEMNKLGMMVDVSHVSDASFYDVLKLTTKPVIASHSCSRALCDNPRNLTDDMLKALSKNGGVVQMCILSAYVKTPDPLPARDSAMKALRAKWHNFQDLTESQMDSARREWWKTDELYPQKLATVSDVCDHIDHMVKVAGIDHVGIGTDFDGGGGVLGCNDVSEMGNITLELVRRGYSKKQIKKIWGGNLMRVMREVERVE